MTLRIQSVPALALLILGMGVAGAQETQRNTVPDEPVQAHPEGDAAISRLKSPYCPGLMLEVCPSPQAKILRDSIQAMAQEGTSADSLVNWMLASYGEEYRAVPRTQGGGLFAWLIPPLAILGGLILVVAVLRHLRRTRTQEESEVESLSEEEEQRVREALAELKQEEEVPF